MTCVPITGDAGGFGLALASRLISRVYPVRIMSRRPAPSGATAE